QIRSDRTEGRFLRRRIRFLAARPDRRAEEGPRDLVSVPPVQRPGSAGHGVGQHRGAPGGAGEGNHLLGPRDVGQVPLGTAHAQGRHQRRQRWCRRYATVRRRCDDALLHERGGTGGPGRVQGKAPSGVRQVPAPPVMPALEHTWPDLPAKGRAFAIGLRNRFRGITGREGMLVRGPAGWGEFSPFAEYGPEESSRWWAACREAACDGWPDPVRDRVPVNVTVPAVPPERAAQIVAAGGCATAKVKVAEKGQAPGEDLARVEAVREALGPSGKVRVDANGAWDVDTAVQMVRALDRFDLEYVEQPCASLDELASVRRRVEVPVAADESIRRAEDPL